MTPARLMIIIVAMAITMLLLGACNITVGDLSTEWCKGAEGPCSEKALPQVDYCQFCLDHKLSEIR